MPTGSAGRRRPIEFSMIVQECGLPPGGPLQGIVILATLRWNSVRQIDAGQSEYG